MKIVIVTLLIVFVFSAPFAGAMLVRKTTLELYVENELILVGKVISLNEIPAENQTEYQIKVERYLKNPQSYDTITAIGRGTKSGELRTSIDKIFNVSDRVLLFLNKKQGNYIISPFSVNAEAFDPDLQFILPPLKLSKAGIATQDIVCRGDLKLVLKTSNSPACIKPKSLERILSIGWTRL